MTAATEANVNLDAALAQASRLLADAPALAGEQALEILKVVPGEPRALLFLGMSWTARGDLSRALGVLEPLVQAHPRFPAAHHELGVALGRSGRGDEALSALRRAVRLKPDYAKAWLALADHHSATGDLEEADRAYANHIRHSTRDPTLLAAASALCDNRIPEAEARLREHLRRSPTDVAAIRMLAEVAARIGRYEDAETLLSRCLELAPGFKAARQNLAQVLHRANKPAEALVEVDRLLRDEPANPGYLNLKAVVLCRLGDFTPAIAIYDRILRDHPGHANVWLSHGHALKTANELERAIAAYRRSIELDPGFGEAWWSLANLKTVRFDSADVAAMRTQLERDELDPDQRCNLEFALGKALEDEAAYAESFEHYARGNALRLEAIPYSAEETTARLRHARGLYTPAFFADRAGWGCPDRDPIFIVGLPRAGSTLIEQILSSHSQVEGTSELPEIISLTRALRLRADASGASYYHEALAALGRDEVRELGEQYLERTRVHRKLGRPNFIDKMPNNFAHLGLIRLALPNARIIDARRHPMACCFSGYKQHFARGQNFSYGLADLGRYYRDYVELMAHFDAALPGHVHRVVYERMVEDTEGEVRRLLAHCGLPFEPGCLKFFENDRPVRTASSEQVRRPIYREGVEHWRHYESWLDPLRVALGPVLEQYPAVPDFTEAP